MSNQKKNRPYEKPELRQVPLRPEEAVLGNCKISGSGGPATGNCAAAGGSGQCNSLSS